MADELVEKERYRKVSLRVWGDEKFRQLSKAPPNGQTLWFLLVFGPYTTPIPGVVLAGPAALAEVVGWDTETFLGTFREPSAMGMAKADWGARLVWVPKAIYHNEPDNPNQVKKWRGTWPLVPESPLKREIYEGLREYFAQRGETFLETFQGTFRVTNSVGSRNQEAGSRKQEAGELRRARPLDRDDPQPSSEAGFQVVLDAYERQQQGVILAGREYQDVRGWVARGWKPERIAEAITVVGEAMRTGAPESRPKAFWRAVTSKLTNTPPDQPIVWLQSLSSPARPKDKPEPRRTSKNWEPQRPPEEKS